MNNFNKLKYTLFALILFIVLCSCVNAEIIRYKTYTNSWCNINDDCDEYTDSICTTLNAFEQYDYVEKDYQAFNMSYLSAKNRDYVGVCVKKWYDRTEEERDNDNGLGIAMDFASNKGKESEVPTTIIKMVGDDNNAYNDCRADLKDCLELEPVTITKTVNITEYINSSCEECAVVETKSNLWFYVLIVCLFVIMTILFITSNSYKSLIKKHYEEFENLKLHFERVKKHNRNLEIALGVKFGEKEK